MIRTLSTRGFSVLRDVDIPFGSGLNIVVGTNGSGKSHLLKLAYSAARWSREMSLRDNGSRPDRITLQRELARKLTAVFGCDHVGRLASRVDAPASAEVEICFSDPEGASFRCAFTSRSRREVEFSRPPTAFVTCDSVFIPSKEVLTLAPGFASLYRDRDLQLDETYFDLCVAMERPLTRGALLSSIKPVLLQVEQALGGRVSQEHGRFWVTRRGEGKFEAGLLAEGYRKLATVAQLLANGAVGPGSTLFWDEPEANLNPELMRRLAEILVAIASGGIQVFVATHSLYLLREFSLLLSADSAPRTEASYVSLHPLGPGQGVRVSVGHSAEEIEPIVALDAELEQSLRYLRQQPAPLSKVRASSVAGSTTMRRFSRLSPLADGGTPENRTATPERSI